VPFAMPLCHGRWLPPRQPAATNAANVKVQACTQGALLFSFLFSNWAEEDFFFSFFLSSKSVSTMCPSSSQWVPIRFLTCFPSSQCVPQHVLHITSLLSYICFGKCCPPFTYIGGPKGMNSTHQNRTFLRSLHSFIFLE
jgi:hypothetical protein